MSNCHVTLKTLRDRIEALVEFAPFMHNYLNKRKIRHAFYVINQGDNFRFNRGALINIGYIESRAECDHICMHDVDTIPVNPNITYPYPEKGPFHVSSPDIHPRNHYKSFVGGILIIRNEHFKELNGFSNRYWGWGAEDDDFGIRMRTKRLTQQPRDKTGLKTLKYDVLGRYVIKIGNTPVNIINVKLSCNPKDTPWCVKPEEHKKYIDQGLITTSKLTNG
ncbi:hypothetical protein KUTeg_004865 [Tegillarca granosa]|uniref:Beta-1,4-galactosyltransferase 7 n=1 Tax=Tegillarca granosa TaxID=220873 RepID=A0ABQ9FLB7_TEGGR|nr:hypothetical protein KUTeg_004865 [Tegillarca granosa]